MEDDDAPGWFESAGTFGAFEDDDEDDKGGSSSSCKLRIFKVLFDEKEKEHVLDAFQTPRIRDVRS